MLTHRNVWLSLSLLTLALVLKNTLTRSMALHMLVHLPLILAAGWFMGRAWLVRKPSNGVLANSNGRKRHYGYNEQGIAGLLLVLLISAWWMLPISLDYVLLSPYYDLFKFISLFLAGLILPGSIAKANQVVVLFFLGNFCWMTAIVGLLYQENSNRLCNFYLLSDQEQTGRGLVILAVVLPLVWLFLKRDQVRHYLRH